MADDLRVQIAVIQNNSLDRVAQEDIVIPDTGRQGQIDTEQERRLLETALNRLRQLYPDGRHRFNVNGHRLNSLSHSEQIIHAFNTPPLIGGVALFLQGTVSGSDSGSDPYVFGSDLGIQARMYYNHVMVGAGVSVWPSVSGSANLSAGFYNRSTRESVHPQRSLAGGEITLGLGGMSGQGSDPIIFFRTSLTTIFELRPNLLLRAGIDHYYRLRSDENYFGYHAGLQININP